MDDLPHHGPPLPVPPLDDWERQGALRELARVAADIDRTDPACIVARMGRLTQDQRAAVAAAMERILDLGCSP